MNCDDISLWYSLCKIIFGAIDVTLLVGDVIGKEKKIENKTFNECKK